MARVFEYENEALPLFAALVVSAHEHEKERHSKSRTTRTVVGCTSLILILVGECHKSCTLDHKIEFEPETDQR